jgi:hypothetical protein
MASRHQIGLDRLMWGADFPHSEGTAPFTREAHRVNFEHVAEPEVRQLLGAAAAECYGFDLAALQTVADRIGPTPAHLGAPLPGADWPRYPHETVCSTFASPPRGEDP